MTRVFDQHERERFAAMVRARDVDHRAAADEASRLAKAWLTDLPAHWPREQLARALVHKAAGYNADLHAWAIRVQRAVGAAREWLAGADALEFQLSDLTLGEYFLLSWCRSRRVTVRSGVALGPALEALLGRHPPRCTRDDAEAFEFPLAGAPGGPADVPDASVLFVATMESYLNPLLPVMEAVARRGSSCMLLAPPESIAWSSLHALPRAVCAVTTDALLTRRDAGEMAARRRRVGEWLARPDTRLAERFTTLGVNLWPLVAPDIHAFGTSYIPAAAWLLDAGRRLATRHGVGAIVCARLRRCAECALALGVQAGGGRCIVVPHGHVGENPARRFVDGSFDTADAVCAWGEEQKRQLLAKNDGVAPGRVVVTGNPAWDALRVSPPRRDDARRRVVRALGWGEDDPGALLVYATQPDAAGQNAAVFRAALAAPGLRLVVKTHPREDARACQAALGGADPARFRVIDGAGPALHPLLAAADAVVTFHSTVNIEALLLGTPVVTAALGELAREDRLVPLERFGLPVCTDEIALARALRSLGENPVAFREMNRAAVARAAETISHRPNGSAADLVASLVLDRPAAAHAA